MKKERYFTPRSVDQQALEMYKSVAGLFHDRGLPFRPSQSALLVLDMQKYFLSPSSHAYIPSAEAIVKGIVQLIEAYSSHGWPIFFSQHGNTPADAGMMAAWWKDMLTPQSADYAIIPEIELSKGQLVQKSQYDAFHQTDLEALLHQEEVRQVVICGVMTHLCCETTARSAFMRRFEVFFPVDGTATYNQDFHRSSLVNLAHGFASLVLMKDILQAVRGEYER